MNTRLTCLRKKLDITQAEFGNKLGVTRAAISRLESGDRNLTDQMILSICREFNVNEHWLRTGDGEMFTPPQSFSLDEQAKKNDLTPFELDLMKRYMEMDKTTRENMIDCFKSVFLQHTETSSVKDSTVEYVVSSRPAVSDGRLTRAQKEEIMKHQLDLEEKAATSSASTTTNGFGKMA